MSWRNRRQAKFGSAQDAQRALLDQLMGAGRNNDLNAPQEEQKRWDDDEVCKWSLMGFCPCNLFTNTRSAMDPCEWEYCPAPEGCMEAFKKEPRKVQRAYEEDFVHYLEGLVGDLDAKIRRDKIHYSIDPLESARADVESRIRRLKRKMEDLAEEGRIDESQKILMEVEKLERMDILSANSGRLKKTLMVCEISGCLYDPMDTAGEDFREGKQFRGWLQIRDAIKKFREEVWPNDKEEDIPGIEDRRSRDRSEAVPVEVGRSQDAERSPRRRSWSRGGGARERRRSRDRRSYRDRDRSRSRRRRRSRSRSRGRRRR